MKINSKENHVIEKGIENAGKFEKSGEKKGIPTNQVKSQNFLKKGISIVKQPLMWSLSKQGNKLLANNGDGGRCITTTTEQNGGNVGADRCVTCATCKTNVCATCATCQTCATCATCIEDV